MDEYEELDNELTLRKVADYSSIRPVRRSFEPRTGPGTQAVLFLDFDGVLHSKNAGKEELFTQVDRLEALLFDHAGLQVVMATSWQSFDSAEKLATIFLPEFRQRVIGGTADSLAQEYVASQKSGWMGTPTFNDRMNLAQGWMAHHRPGVPLISLDDDLWRFDYRCPRLLLCTDEYGEAEDELLREWMTDPTRDMQSLISANTPADPHCWLARDAIAAVILDAEGLPVLDALPTPLRDAGMRLMDGEPDMRKWNDLLANWVRGGRGPLLMSREDLRKGWLS